MADDREPYRVPVSNYARDAVPGAHLLAPATVIDQPIRVTAAARPTPAIPHKANTQAVVMKVHKAPVVVFSDLALAKMARYVGFCAEEVGWMGFVDHEEGTALYTVSDVLLFKQRVHAATTEISADALAEMTMELLESPDGVERVNTMRFWGHSHVNMAVNPSGQDDAQMNVFADNGCEFMIRAICNKRGEMKVDVYDYEVGITWVDANWQTERRFDPMDAEIRAEMEAKVSSIRTLPALPKLDAKTPLTPPGGDYRVVRRGVFADDDDDGFEEIRGEADFTRPLDGNLQYGMGLEADDDWIDSPPRRRR